MGTLEKILREIDQHILDNPTHGINCVCMDTHIRHLRLLIPDPRSEATARINYIFQMVSKV